MLSMVIIKGEKMKETLGWLFCVALVWILINSFTYWYIHPELSEMEVFMHIPQSVVMQFDEWN